MTTIDEQFAVLVGHATAALEYMLRTDSHSVTYTIDRLTSQLRNSGDDRIVVNDAAGERLARAAEDIRSGKTPSLYFWIGFLERVGGPTALTKKYRETQRAIADANIGLVYKMAKAFANKYPARWEIEDFISEGYIGLRNAVELFEPGRGFKFSTYAMTWIRQKINRYIFKNTSITHIPEDVLVKRIKLGEHKNAVSLTPDSNDADESFEIQSNGPAPDRQQEATEETERLEEHLSTLDPRERRIINLRFGLGGAASMTLKEIGSLMEISHTRVMQIEGRALKKLKEMSK